MDNHSPPRDTPRGFLDQVKAMEDRHLAADALHHYANALRGISDLVTGPARAIIVRRATRAEHIANDIDREARLV